MRFQILNQLPIGAQSSPKMVVFGIKSEDWEKSGSFLKKNQKIISTCVCHYGAHFSQIASKIFIFDEVIALLVIFISYKTQNTAFREFFSKMRSYTLQVFPKCV